MNLNNNEFNILKDFIYIISNIDLKENKKYLIEQRLYPLLKKYNLRSFSALIEMLANPSKTLIDEIISAITTNETFFFRDVHIFLEIENFLIPKIFDIAKRRSLTIWSAACSTGQEPYTIAMLIDSYAEEQSLEKYLGRIRIKATDLDGNVLNIAKNGKYNNFDINRGLPLEFKDKYFEKNADNTYTITKKLKDMITFYRMNLTSFALYPSNIDIILCRNVLIYFDEDSKNNILNTLYKSLNNDGYLILGSTENLYNNKLLFKKIEKGRLTLWTK